MTIGIASAVWRATATSYESFIGACVLSGFACGPGETFGPMVRCMLSLYKSTH